MATFFELRTGQSLSDARGFMSSMDDETVWIARGR